MSVNIPETPLIGFVLRMWIRFPAPSASISMTERSSFGSATRIERVRSRPMPAKASVAWEFTFLGKSGHIPRVGPS